MDEELKRLNYTLEYVEKSIDIAMEKKGIWDEKVQTGKGFSSDASQMYTEKMMATMFSKQTDIRLRNLLVARTKPYFARLDFRENNQEEGERLYIGKMALIKEKNQELLIVDWRAPIANLYYEGRLGEAQYDSPSGKIEGQLQLKRQITIDNGQLINYSDIDITTNDTFLQASLGANADNRLKEIVSTIQEEQNSVIRAHMWTPLIVQGAAGSGKTTIALHRMAYLIYTYEHSFSPENFMIVAPNKLFLNYISDILPDLGVEKAIQSTFEDFAEKIIGQKLKLCPPNEKMEVFVKGIDKNLWNTAQLKCDMIFKNVFDQYISHIEASYIPRKNLTIWDIVIFEYKELNRLFIEEYYRLPIAKRIDELKKHMNTALKLKSINIRKKIETDCDNRVRQIKENFPDGESKQEKIIDVISEKNSKISSFEKESKVLVREYLKKISKLNPVQYYKDFMGDYDNMELFIERGVDENLVRYLFDRSNEYLGRGYLELEDLAPIIYLKYKIHGIDAKISVKHIIIDEAQDFSVFQLYCIKTIIKESSFTILGDLSQGIHAYRGMQAWEDLIEGVFGGQRVKLLTLTQTYRTTVEIAEAANAAIATLHDKKLIPAEPVLRHGKPVEISKLENQDALVKRIKEHLKLIEEKGKYKSIAIICKSVEECHEIYDKINNKSKVSIITGNEKEYRGGIVVVPVYLAKGLEFDVVIIANANDVLYDVNELNVKLLYVAMTRALHELYIYYVGEKSGIIRK